MNTTYLGCTHIEGKIPDAIIRFKARGEIFIRIFCCQECALRILGDDIACYDFVSVSWIKEPV